MTAYGLIKNSPGIATVGITTMSQPNRNEKGWTVRWKDVREVKFKQEKREIMLKEKWFNGGLGGGLGTLELYCTPENYETVASACQTFQNRTPKQTTPHTKASSPSAKIINYIPSASSPTFNSNFSNLRRTTSLHPTIQQMVLLHRQEIRIETSYLLNARAE
jgi:hypothetical protein